MLRLILSFALMSWFAIAAAADEKPEATMYRVPFCGCCDGHADHLRAHGYRVKIIETRNMTEVKRKYGVPQQFEGCHTIDIAGYVVEGHVPAPVIDRLLREKPSIRGISLPGMPEGSPGMSGIKKEPFTIYELSDSAKVYATD